MKKVLIILVAASFLIAFAAPPARSDEPSGSAPPVSQALVREGDFAVMLAEQLGLGSPSDEARAEDMLMAVGVAPRNGWISDYPITPVVMGELQSSVAQAAASGKLAMSGTEATNALSRVASQVGLPIRGDDGSYSQGAQMNTSEYTDYAAVDDYYADEGPPVVSYYTPPSDYGYLYDYVDYPFWWGGFFFPGFFILNDFDVFVHDHNFRHHHRDEFRHRRDNFRHVSNHVRDNRGRETRVNASNMNRTTITNARANGNGIRSKGFSSEHLNSARSIVNRDAERGNMVSGRTMGAGGTRASMGRSNGFEGRRSMSSGRSSSTTPRFEGGGGLGGSSRSFTGSSSFGGRSHSFSSSGFGHGFSGGMGRSGGFGGGGGFHGGGGFGGGFHGGGGGFHGGGGHGGGGGHR